VRTKRERELVWLLLVVLLVTVPYYVFDQLARPRALALQAVTERVAAARRQVRAVRRAQERLREAEAAATVPPARLLGDLPFADVERELGLVASASGAAIERLSLYAGEPLEHVPWLQPYRADVVVGGSYAQFVAFLRSLEEHALLVEVPDLILQLPSDGKDELTTSLELHFYRQVQAQPADTAAGADEGKAGSAGSAAGPSEGEASLPENEAEPDAE